MREVIEVVRCPPVDRQMQSSASSDDDYGATGSGPHTDPRVPGLAFENWPFGDLEVNISSKKKQEKWGAYGPGHG